MSRLPTPGGDDGTWGDILNDFLTQSHNSDGSLKAIDPTKVTGTALVNSQLGANSGVAGLDSGGTLTSSQVPLTVSGRIYATKSIKDYGAVSGADCTTAFTNALATCSNGDALFIPAGTWKLGASGGGIAIPDGVKLVGAGRKASIIQTNYSGTARVKMLAPSGTAEFADIGFNQPGSTDRTAQVQVIFAQATATRVAIDRCDFIGGFAICVDTWQDEITDVYMRDVLIDGQSAGLASGQNRQAVMGVAHNGAGRFVMDNCVFTGLGSDASDKPFSSHCIYAAPNTTLQLSHCRFYNHIQGRLIQFYNGFQVTPPSPIGPDVIRDCEFGAYNSSASANPYTVCETSELKNTSYIDCHWASITTTTNYVINIKATCRFTGSRFDGTSTVPSGYLGNPDSFAGSNYDANGAFFNNVKYSDPVASATQFPYAGFNSTFIAASCDPMLANNAGQPGAASYLGLIYIPGTITVSSITVNVFTAGSGLTAGQNQTGIIRASDGVVIATSADQSSAWTSTGMKTAAITATSGNSLTLSSGYYYLALCSFGTTKPFFGRIPAGSHSGPDTFNAGFASGQPRSAAGNVSAGTISATPSPIANSALFFFGLS